MEQNDKIQLFEDKRIRTAWDEEKEEWYFSIVDVCDVLSELDRDRQRFILRNIDDMQVFITCCDSRVLDGTEGKIFSVSGGRITEG